MPKDSKHGRKKKTAEAGVAAKLKAIESNTTIAALAMTGANPWQGVVVYVCYGIILIAIIVLGIPPYESSKQLTAMLVGVIPLFIAFVMLVHRYRELSQKGSAPPPDILEMHPRTIQLSNVVYERVRTVLEDARRKVYELLRQKNPHLSDDQVRANIFFPEYGPSGDPNDYVLRIYPGLHIKMNHPPELEITFQPGQGATGRVFESGQARVTQRLESGSGDWDAIYDITDELATIIHPDLKWIISMPLEGEDGKPIGVMNIDGLRDQFHVDVLYECIAKVTDSVIIISKLVAGN